MRRPASWAWLLLLLAVKAHSTQLRALKLRGGAAALSAAKPGLQPRLNVTAKQLERGGALAAAKPTPQPRTNVTAEAEADLAAFLAFRARVARLFEYKAALLRRNYARLAEHLQSVTTYDFIHEARDLVRRWMPRLRITSFTRLLLLILLLVRRAKPHKHTRLLRQLRQVHFTAFTSEVGESMRPLMAPWKVTLCYVISRTYVALDILLHTANELWVRGLTWRVLRALIFISTFHALATMMVPAYLVHAAVHLTQHTLQLSTAAAAAAAAAAANGSPEAAAVAAAAGEAAAAMTDARLLPTVVGLLTIPLLPLLDKPMEHALEYAFGRVWPLPPRPLGEHASRRIHRSLAQPERALHHRDVHREQAEMTSSRMGPAPRMAPSAHHFAHEDGETRYEPKSRAQITPAMRAVLETNAAAARRPAAVPVPSASAGGAIGGRSTGVAAPGAAAAGAAAGAAAAAGTTIRQ